MSTLNLKASRVSNVNPVTKQKGLTVRVLTNGTADFDSIVTLAGKNTTMHRAELRMAFELCLDSVADALKEGMIVDLGPIGKIYPSCTSKWYEKAEDMKLSDVHPGLYFRAGEERRKKAVPPPSRARRLIRPSRPSRPSRATAGAATTIPTTGWNRFRGKGGSDGGRVAGLLHIHYIIGLDAIAGIRADGQYKGG